MGTRAREKGSVAVKLNRASRLFGAVRFEAGWLATPPPRVRFPAAPMRCKYVPVGERLKPADWQFRRTELALGAAGSNPAGDFRTRTARRSTSRRRPTVST